MIIFIFDSKEDSDKFTAIYEKYGRLLYYTIRRFVGSKYIIEDLSQETYISIFTHLSKINMADVKKTRNYIITIARNHCKNHLRDQEKIKEDLEDNFSFCESKSEDIVEFVLNQERVSQVKEEIKKLDDIYRSILELKYENDFSNDEIAEFLGIKKKTVEMRVYRARKILQERLKNS